MYKKVIAINERENILSFEKDKEYLLNTYTYYKKEISWQFQIKSF